MKNGKYDQNYTILNRRTYELEKFPAMKNGWVNKKDGIHQMNHYDKIINASKEIIYTMEIAETRK